MRRATAGLNVGTLDDAKEAIEEAASLDPADEEIKSLAAKISAAAVSPAPMSVTAVATPAAEWIGAEPLHAELLHAESLDGTIAFEDEGSSSSARQWFAIAAALIVMSGLAGWIWTRAQLTPAPETPDAAASIAETTLPARLTESTAPPPDVPQPEAAAAVPFAATDTSPSPAAGTSGSVPEAAAAQSPAISASPETLAAAEPAVKPIATESSALPAVTLPPVHAADNRSTETSAPAADNGTTPSAAVPALAEPPPSVAPPAIPMAEGSSLSSTIGESVAARAPQVPAGADSVAEERAIRAVLGRYEAAYNRLDAAAAGAVRPSVDRQALARAFEGLVSQTVKLGLCNVAVTGGSAQAACTGTAQWTPRIGGETQTAKRQWRFDLKKTGADWIIVSATVR